MKRCTQCDIPLEVRPCPNPLCQEMHGQSAGDLCTWCSQQIGHTPRAEQEMETALLAGMTLSRGTPATLEWDLAHVQ